MNYALSALVYTLEFVARHAPPQQGLLPLVAYVLGLGQEEQIPLQD
jgi:hypothetical protein